VAVNIVLGMSGSCLVPWSRPLHNILNSIPLYFFHLRALGLNFSLPR
jgi:hypothetical protein